VNVNGVGLGLISRHLSDVPAVWRLFLIECRSPILSLPVLRFPVVTSISDSDLHSRSPDLLSSFLLLATFCYLHVSFSNLQ